MKNVNVTKRRKGQKGFTLVELAVVMIIVGLLIGGILKGQELITNAQVSSLITQVKSVDAAMSTFRDSYRAVPGDMGTAVARLPNCTAGNNCANGGADGQISVAATGVSGAESFQAFKHMALADVFGGVDPSTAAANTFGTDFPAASIGGGLSIGHQVIGDPGAIVGTPLRAGHYVILNSTANTAVANGTGPLTSDQAFRVDTKMDDGEPDTGSVRSNQGTCVTGAGIYDTAGGGDACAMLFRVQG